MPRPRPPHLHRQVTRHKRTVWYVRIGKGKRVRLRAEYGSEAFDLEYRAAVAGEAPPTRRGGRAGSLSWLIDRYKETPAWAKLSLSTRRMRENIFKRIIAVSGAEPFDRITRKAVIAARDKKKDAPSTARHMIDALRGVFQWAVEAEIAKSDPTLGVKAPKVKTDGHPMWTDEWCDKFERFWKVGTRQRLAYDLLLYTGLRRGDAVKLGRQHVKDGVATLKTEKTGEVVTIPILAPLADSIAASPTSDLAFISGDRGEPLTKESFGNYFSEWCRKAGVPGRAHGLRKAAATRVANNGATVAQLEALFGWRGGGMASLYTRKADRVRLATEAAEKLMPNTYSPTSNKGEGRTAKR